MRAYLCHRTAIASRPGAAGPVYKGGRHLGPVICTETTYRYTSMGIIRFTTMTNHLLLIAVVIPVLTIAFAAHVQVRATACIINSLILQLYYFILFTSLKKKSARDVFLGLVSRCQDFWAVKKS